MTEKKIYKVPAISPRGFLIEIIDSEYNPIEGVEFSYVVDGSSSKNGTTDDRGILNIRPLPQNEVKLSFGEQLESPPEMEEETTKEHEEIAETAFSEVEITEKTEEIDETTSSEAFRIKIVDYEQNPIKGAEFSYIVDGIYSKNGTTDDQGILKVQPMPKNEVKLSLGGVVTPDEDQLRGDLGVLVVDNNNQPISQAIVSAAGPESPPSCSSDDDGIVLFHNIQAGNYTITASKLDFSSDTQQATVIAVASVSARPSASDSNNTRSFADKTKNTGNEPPGGSSYAILRLSAKTKLQNVKVSPRFIMPKQPGGKDFVPVNGLFAYIPVFSTETENIPSEVEVYVMKNGLITELDSDTKIKIRCQNNFFIYFSSAGNLAKKDTERRFPRDKTGLSIIGPLQIPCEEDAEILIDIWKQNDWISIDPLELVMI